jgi:hypothetical protein
MSRLLSIDMLWLALLASLLLLQVWFPFSGPGLVNDTYSVEISGRRAVFELAEKRFAEVRRNHDPLLKAVEWLDSENEALALLGPARYPTAAEWTELLAWVGDGGRLLVAAPLQVDRGFEIPTLNAKVEMPELEAAEAVKAALEMEKGLPGLKTSMLSGNPAFRWVSAGKVVPPPGSDALIDSDEGNQAVRIRYGQGWIVLLASDYIFTNGSLNRPDTVNPYLAYRLLRTVVGERGVVFDESLNSAAQPTVEGLLLSDSVRPATLHLCVLLVVFSWMGTRRFGGMLPKTFQPRHDIVDHTNALGNLYFKRNDAAGVLQRYFEQWRLDLRLGTQRKDAAQIERLARRTDRSTGYIKRLLTETEGALGNARLTRRDAARYIEKLAEFRAAVREG